MNIDIIADGLEFPEGPAFDAQGDLWAVELKGGGLIRWSGGSYERVPTGGGPNGIVIDDAGRVLFCDSAERSIRRHDPSAGRTDTMATHVDGEILNKPNDLAFDAVGNLLFTCPGDSRQEPTGYACVMAPSGEVRKIAEGYYFPNGLVFNADGSQLIIAETYKQRLWVGDWDPAELSWTNPRVWAEGLVGAPGPDGMAWGKDGRLYVAVYGSGAVYVISEYGEILDRIELPGKNPTNCAFDPSGELGLVVTEAEQGRLLSIPGLGTGIPLFAGV
ncbi:SMP-30/gluconolactonase/LRE family protein [Coraliomargarita parva]|uniref:SMP-30/gluconolactonase/LRE family protein n=1 Tax=Coraliomargarita parva TaxID=3014050 RepID=UPI0022B343F4|nr:SMP-30/gluconolactonase/LRE family protein [Coraliomargarita parva]